MAQALAGDKYDQPRTLLYSQRNIFPYDAWRCQLYELEDTILQMESAELLAPLPDARFKWGNKIAKRVLRYSPLALNPGVPRIELTGNYDLLFVACTLPWDLLTFNLGDGWKDHVKTSICLIDEIWMRQIPQQKHFLKILSQFDHVVLYYSQSVKAVSALIGKPCSFLPPGVDALRFFPYPHSLHRAIDVYSFGRRSKVTHRSLLDMTEKGGLFYIYDSLSGKRVLDSKEHRMLLANLAKRSRFFLVNPGLVDEPDKRGEQFEGGSRYFEGAAAGCILIGEIPDNEEFKRLFDWPDAVIPLPFDSDRIDEVIEDLDKQPDREDRISRDNVCHSLRRHDWAHRWESVLQIAGLDPMPGLLNRKRRLEEFAAAIEEGPGPRGPKS